MAQNTITKFHNILFLNLGKEGSYFPGNDKYAERGDMETNFRSYLFNDTTRLRMTSRPNVKEAFQRTPNTASLNKNVSSKLGRRGISQSFKEKLISPTRPKDPPPPPPNVNQLSKSQSVTVIKSHQNVSSTSNQTQNSRKFIQFSAPEMKRLNRMIMRRSSSTPATNNLQAGGSTKAIYDIAENEDEDMSFTHTSINPSSNNGKYLTSGSTSVTSGQENRVINYCTSSLQRNPIKPPRKSDRSHSFSLRQQNPIKTKSNIFNRSISQIARSISNSSLEEGHQKNLPVHQPDPYAHNNENSMKGFSSTDLVTLLPHEDLEERMGFKDIRKILSSPSISSSASSTTSGHYQLKRGLMNSRQRKCSEADRSDDNNRSSEHIYEEIPENENNMKSASAIRPLPPLPIHQASQQPETTSLKEKKLSSSSTATIKTVTSEINSEAQVKSIFEGATKYDILHYLEDAKERGLTDVELDAPDEAEDVEENDDDNRQPLVRRNHANRVSNISNSSSGSSSASSGSAILMANKDRWSSVDIERNDSGLGSETGKTGKRPGVRIREKQQSIETIFADHHEHICEDCDQPIEDVSHIEWWVQL